jgi:hypothetical protein
MSEMLPKDNSPRADQGLIVMEGMGAGEINGYRFNSFAHLDIDPEANAYEQVIAVDDIPELENALLASSGSCYVTSTGGIFAQATRGAVNLLDVMGMPYKAEVDYLHIDDTGTQVGELHQTLEVAEIAPKRYEVKPFVEGWYKGPKDLCWTPGYAIYLRQAGPGLIEGVYGQTIFAHSGRINALVRRRYHYQSDRTLPCDEVWHYKILKLDVDVADGRRRFVAHVTTCFIPAEAQHGDVPESLEVLRRF